jgi:hypothetical protein
LVDLPDEKQDRIPQFWSDVDYGRGCPLWPRTGSLTQVLGSGLNRANRRPARGGEPALGRVPAPGQRGPLQDRDRTIVVTGPNRLLYDATWPICLRSEPQCLQNREGHLAAGNLKQRGRSGQPVDRPAMVPMPCVVLLGEGLCERLRERLDNIEEFGRGRSHHGAPPKRNVSSSRPLLGLGWETPPNEKPTGYRGDDDPEGASGKELSSSFGTGPPLELVAARIVARSTNLPGASRRTTCGASFCPRPREIALLRPLTWPSCSPPDPGGLCAPLPRASRSHATQFQAGVYSGVARSRKRFRPKGPTRTRPDLQDVRDAPNEFFAENGKFPVRGPGRRRDMPSWIGPSFARPLPPAAPGSPAPRP